MSANLSQLKIGSLQLAPEFDSDVLNYTVTTTNDTNKLTAVAEDEHSIIECKLGDAAVNNNSSLTWAAGENIVTVKVTDDTDATVTKTYTVTVTKQ